MQIVSYISYTIIYVLIFSIFFKEDRRVALTAQSSVNATWRRRLDSIRRFNSIRMRAGTRGTQRVTATAACRVIEEFNESTKWIESSNRRIELFKLKIMSASDSKQQIMYIYVYIYI